MALKYKIGDRVRIKSLDWYNKNKDEYDYIDFGKHMFYPPMSKYCGEVFTIDYVYSDFYTMNNNDFEWTDEMIEGLVEEENEKKLSDESWRYKNIFDNSQYPQSFECPEGYIFKDENGNVINATKIVLEKKKKWYPKSYNECCEILDVSTCLGFEGMTDGEVDLYGNFISLIRCRDAYWKIAGEEMGLGKPWKPSGNEDCFVVSRSCGEVDLYSSAGDCGPFEFPTAKMRDAFYENFKELIESCKELL